LTKKEIAEIRKTIRAEGGCTHRIAGCYVSAEREQRMTFSGMFGNLPEEEVYKYVDILKKGLTGTQKVTDIRITKCSDALYGAWYSECKEEEKLDALYQQIIDSYTPSGNYLILISYGIYDVPAIGKDGKKQDESEDIFRYMTVSICPVILSDAGLCCEADGVQPAKRSWMIKPPAESFLYPAFNERYEDHDAVLYYAGKFISQELVEALFGVEEKVNTATEHKALYTEVLSEALGESCTLEVMTGMQECFEETDDEILTPMDMKEFAIASGAAKEDAERMETKLKEMHDDGEIKTALVTEKTLTVQTGEATIKAKAESGIFRRNIDGYECLVIPLQGEVLVNGVPVNG